MQYFPLRLVAIIGLVLFSVNAAGGQKAPATNHPKGWRRNQVDNIHEAVFRYQFAHDQSLFQGRVSVYFLSFSRVTTDGKLHYRGKDPGRKFLERFMGNQPPVKGVSQCHAERKEVQVRDDKTDQPGALFTNDTVTWKDDDTVQVEGECFLGSLDATGGLYTVTYRDNQWVVTEQSSGWVS